MIIEQATFTITPGAAADFEAALAGAAELLVQAQGFQSLRLARGIEAPSTYVMLVEWDSVEDHLVGFRESEDFGRWRELVGPFFAAPPAVVHFEAPVVSRP